MAPVGVEATAQAPKELLVDKVLNFIKPDGRVSQHLKGFEPREQQQRMMRDIISAYNQQEITLIEAGTGTGKSMAYLIPALLWAAKNQKRTVISTHTITLQEQLVEKDIPLLLKALGLDLKAVLVKGMGNYVCLRKFEDALYALPTHAEREARELGILRDWLPNTKDGTRSDLPLVPSTMTWELIGAEPDTCNWKRCPHHHHCHFVKARDNAQDAQILVVNHHLLFADLSRRAQEDNYDSPAVLPAYSHVVIDEAHNIEDVATDYFATTLTRYETSRLMARLASERTGKLTDLKRVLTDAMGRKRGSYSPELQRIAIILSTELPALRRDLLQGFADAFEAFETFVFNYSEATSEGEQENGPGERKMRVLPKHHEHPHWTSKILPTVNALVAGIQKFTTTIILMLKALEKVPEEELVDKTFLLRQDLQALTNRLSGYGLVLENYVKTTCAKDRVRWIETHPHRLSANVELIDAALDVSKMLREFLFEKFDSVVLCSATLTVSRNFAFLRERLGVAEALVGGKKVQESSYDSPFAYDKQALLAVPTDMPEPNQPEFIQAATERIWQTINISRGNALVLFTSYSMLNTCYRALEAHMVNGRFVSLKQGDDSRYNLLERFRNTDRSILFATHSFWEGVDISGEALRCVIIVKLPFKVPTEPLIQARTEAITSAGGDAFMDYSVPLAIVKFKQGFGRLIRHKKDRGCIVCLDPRLITKRYGCHFLNSLPACQSVFGTSAEITAAMKDFFRRTHYLTL